jgi:cation diffusion facilitator CzcD-associated flavoprotein CzcO
VALGRLPVSVVVIGAGAPPELGLGECTVLGDAATVRFDNDTETWTVTSGDGRSVTARVVVDARPSANPALAAHGVPNHFRIPGPDVRRQARYVARCLRLIERSGANRVEARGRIVLHRWRPAPVATRFYLTGSEPGPDDLYDGSATVTINGDEIASRVRLTGHLDAIDGRDHWQGTVFEALPIDARARSSGVLVTIGDRTAAARVVEQTPWGTHMICGVGDPPFVR